MADNDYIWFQVIESLRVQIAPYSSDRERAFENSAEVKLKLMTLSDEELGQLAEMFAATLGQSTEWILKELRRLIAQYGELAGKWHPQVQLPPPINEPLLKTASLSVLIVEADSALQRELEQVFTKANFTVTSVATYPEAIESLVESKPRVIIIDCESPYGDGFADCAKLRSAFSIPIILLGTDTSEIAWLRVLEAGADYYEIKPCRYTALIARVKSIIWRRSIAPLVPFSN